MSFFDALRHRLSVLRRGEAYGDEQAREAQFHLELAAQNHGAMATPLDAEMAARREFGNVTRYREDARAMSPLRWLDRIRQDFGYAWRGLRKAPAFASAVIITLAVGVGLDAAVFTLLDRLFVRPPAGVAAPRELRRLYLETSHRRPGQPWVIESAPIGVYRIMASVLGEPRVAAYTASDSVGIEAPAEFVAKRTYVSSNYFALLGVRLQLGRAFPPGEDEPGYAKPLLVVISDDLWRRVFRGDRSVVGRTARIDGEIYTVIGVAARGFSGTDLDRVDLWSPLANYHRDLWHRQVAGFDFVRAVARVPAESLSPYEAAIAARAYPETTSPVPRPPNLDFLDRGTYAPPHIIDGPIVEALGPLAQTPETSISLRIAAVALIVLLIACANVANLLLLRAARRGREIAVRRALGVSRARLTEQFLVEALLLAAVGGVAALAVAYFAGRLLRQLLFPTISWSGGVIDLRAIVLLSTVAVFAGIFAGVAPAVAAANPDVMALLRGGRDGGSHGRRMRSALVIVQTALCVVLLVGAMLFVRSLLSAEAVGVGYTTHEVASADLEPAPGEGPRAATGRAEQFERVAQALRSLPGVRSTATASVPPLQGTLQVGVFRPGSDSMLKVGRTVPIVTAVTRDYFATVGIARIQGRTFGDADFAPDAAPVMVVSRQMANAVWPGQSPIGRCLIVHLKTSLCHTVVGVVEDVHASRIVEPSLLPWYYLPFGASVIPRPAILVRADPRSMGRVMTELRARLMSIVPDKRRIRVRTLAQLLEPELRPWLVGAQLFTALGALALIVAAVGIYSVASYAMAQRSHEIGVRLAFGARSADIFRLALRSGLATLTIAAVLGVVVAVVLARYVQSLLYGVTPTDVTTLVGAALALLVVGVIAGVVPAWRASRIDPARTLAAE